MATLTVIVRTIAGVALLGSTTLSAAGAEDLAPGTRVRVTGKGVGSPVGSLVGIDPDGVRLRLADTGTAVIRLADVERIEVSRRPSRREKWALVGFAIGAFVGFAAGAGSTKPNGLFSGTESGVMVAVPLALLGAGIGAAEGGEKWERVEDSRLQVGLASSGRGGLGVAVRF